MILNHKNFQYDKELLNVKRKQKFSQEFTFSQIKYNSQEFLIQTPVLFVPFGIQQYSINDSKKYLDLSFQNIENDKNIQVFLDNLKKIHSSIKEYFQEYTVDNFLKETKFPSLLRLKVDDNCLFFDQNKEPYEGDLPKTYGSFIIHLTGLWSMNQKIWFQWQLLQAKIKIPFVLKEYAFIDDDEEEKEKTIQSKIPPPPPPPPPPVCSKYSKMLKLGIPKGAVEQKKTLDRIRPEDLQKVKLKKGKVIDKKNKDENFTPSLDEIRNALQSLQKIK